MYNLQAADKKIGTTISSARLFMVCSIASEDISIVACIQLGNLIESGLHYFTVGENG
jgi:hypothetical protein